MSGYFVGKEVTHVRDLVIAALLANENCLIVGPPGAGKTSPVTSMLQHIYGPDRYGFLEMQIGGVGKGIAGGVNEEELLTSGEYRWDYTSSTYDPKYQAVIVDELSRTNMMDVSALIHSMERKKMAQVPFVGTTNFVEASAFNEAMFSRFSLMYWFNQKSEDVDIDAICDAVAEQITSGKKLLTVPGKLPTELEIQDVRAAIPGPKATAAIKRALRGIKEAAMAERMDFTKRRPTQWFKLLYYTGVYYSNGDPDFDKLPEQALSILQYAWENLDPETAEKWRELAQSAKDPVGTAIDAIMTETIAEFERVAAISYAADRRNEAATLTMALQSGQQNLFQLGDDSRIREAIDKMSRWLGQALAGEKIERG